MKNGILICLMVISSLLPFDLLAKVRPVISIGTGIDYTQLHANQNIVILSPFHNTYRGNNSILAYTGGLFVGFEGVVNQYLSGQLGISYYQNASYQASGIVYQFGDPALANLKYQYNIVSKRFFVESKLLATVRKKYHPYLNAGVGVSNNTAHQYSEIPVSSADVPMAQGFAGHTSRSFAYMAGAGIDVDVADHIRLGALYRFVDLGSAQLNTTPLSDSGDFLKSNRLRVNEFFMQLTYVR
jgi:opacity protein-like surface antigen